MQEVERTFKPEFINRLDEIIVFNALNDDVLSEIADKFIDETRARLANQEIYVTVSYEAKKRIISVGSDAKFGARPMKRHIQKEIETLLAIGIIDGSLHKNSRVVVDVKDDRYIIRDLQIVLN